MADSGITKGCTRSTHSGVCEVVSFSFVPGDPNRYPAQIDELRFWPMTKADDVMKLRRLTGFGVLQCKFLIDDAGSLDAAIKHIETQRTPIGFASYSGICPECGTGHRSGTQMDCPKCDWVRVEPQHRDRWGKVGKCPSCGFTYRWDGSTCSHCGFVSETQ